MEEKLKSKWEILYEMILGLNYGDMLSHDRIANILNQTYNTNKYRSDVNKVKKALLKEGKQIESIHRLGYRVAYPGNYTNMSVAKISKGAREIQRGYDIAVYAPLEAMNEIERTVHRDYLDKLTFIHASVVENIVQLNLSAKKSHPLLANNIQ